jgi:hypothetical protein
MGHHHGKSVNIGASIATQLRALILDSIWVRIPFEIAFTYEAQTRLEAGPCMFCWG